MAERIGLPRRPIGPSQPIGSVHVSPPPLPASKPAVFTRRRQFREGHLGPSQPINLLPEPRDFGGGPLVVDTPKCGICGQKFATEQGLKIHTGRKHG